MNDHHLPPMGWPLSYVLRGLEAQLTLAQRARLGVRVEPTPTGWRVVRIGAVRWGKEGGGMGETVCAKTRYETKLDAELALSRISLETARGPVQKAPRRSYECPDCLGWHLTSRA